jgi:hypothetical protein
MIGSAVYGEFEAEARERIGQLDPEDWPMLAAALALVTANGLGESAAAVWRQIQSETNILNCADSPAPEPTLAAEDESITPSLVRPAPTVEAAGEALRFGTRPPSMRPLPRRREAPPADAQLPLF